MVLPFSSNGRFAIGGLPPGFFEIARDHLLDHLGEGRFGLPAELLPRLAGVTAEKIYFGRPEIDRIDPDQGLAGLHIDTSLVDPLAAPFDAAADLGKCQ